MTDLKPEDLVKRVEDMADFLVGDKGVFLSADVADEHAADLRALLADRARMEKALREAEEVLALVEHPRMVDPDYGDEVEALGRRIGFGALMSSAQASWRKHSAIPGGEHVAGPCFATVVGTLKTIRQALGASQ